LAEGNTRLLALPGLLDVGQCRRLLALLETQLAPLVVPMEQRVPSSAETTRNYQERLPKTVRAQSAMFDAPRAKSYARGRELGLLQMLRSTSFHQFAQALSGYPLRRKNGVQALRYQAGDYAGPHNDAHPDDAEAAQGYTDVHISLSALGVKHQWLVSEKAGHFSQMVDVSRPGLVTCYRLPFWHFTTPLQCKPKRVRECQRWVLLGTFLDDWAQMT
jgi:hypothetical protein